MYNFLLNQNQDNILSQQTITYYLYEDWNFPIQIRSRVAGRDYLHMQIKWNANLNSLGRIGSACTEALSRGRVEILKAENFSICSTMANPSGEDMEEKERHGKVYS